MIDHTNIFYRIWNACFVVSTIVSSIEYGYIGVFFKKNDDHNKMMIFFEIFFILRIFTQFFVTYENPHKRNDIVKDVEQLASNYYNTNFFRDLIPSIPLQFIRMGGYERYWYFIKCFRILIGLKVISVSSIM